MEKRIYGILWDLKYLCKWQHLEQQLLIMGKELASEMWKATAVLPSFVILI